MSPIVSAGKYCPPARFAEFVYNAAISLTRRPMLARIASLLCCLLFAPVHAAEISGAGSSAAMPLYLRLAAAYAVPGATTLAYQGSGSAAGLRQIRERRVDFGASDVAPGAAELASAKLVSFPSAISGVVPVFNVPGLRSGELLLTGELLADIFGRKITRWNDARLAAVNPRASLPALPIVVLVRSDGSGTTYNFTDYLSEASSDWQQVFGRNLAIAWPADTVAVKGSAGVVAALRQTVGAIAYVDYNYVQQEKLAYAKLRNRDGRFVAPSADGFAVALDHSGWKTEGRYEEMLTNKAGGASWPITMGTFVIVPRMAGRPETMIATLKFFTWGFLYGEQIVGAANFVRLPDRVQARVYAEFTKITDSRGQPLRWTLAEVMASHP